MPIVLTPRPARVPVPLPEPAVVRIPAPPAVPMSHEGIATAVLAGAGSLGTLAVLGTGRRSSPLLLIGLGLATLGATVGARLIVGRRARRQQRRAAARWAARVDACVDQVRAAASQQRVARRRTHPVGRAQLSAVARGASQLWERRPDAIDAWAVSVGVGRVAPLVRLESDRTDATTEVAPDLEEVARSAAQEWAEVAGVPMVVDLARGAVALVGGRDDVRDAARHLVAELAVARPPDEVRIAVLTDDPEAWAWLRWLPHAQHGDGSSVLSSVDELDPVLTRDALVVVDRVDLSGLDLDRGPGARWVVLADGAESLPPRIMTTVLLGDGGGVVRTGAGVAPIDVLARLDAVAADDIARLLSPRRVAGVASVADGEVRIGQLLGVDVLNHDAAAWWAGIDRPVVGAPRPEVAGRRASGGRPLAVPIGRDLGGAPVVLDLAEPALGGHGPHGLLIGATGSGKSELLRSLVTGLAVTAAPHDVALLLIDWKGGAAFDGLASLPHVAGLVTNLAGDAALVDRVCASLRGELERRQQVLRVAGAESVRSLRERGADAPPALIVVIDEFGELLSGHPDVLDVLLQVGRLGRSLAVHLVLASQRLDEGRLRGLDAHLRFRLCLRTFTAAESVAVLGGPEAATLPGTPGEGWLVVDGERTRIRAAYASAPAVPPTPPPPVRLLTSSPTSALCGSDRPGDPHKAGVDELGALVAAIARVGAARAAPVWLPPLPDDVRGLDAVALVDEPAQQRQVPWSPGAHSAVVGAPGAGVSTALSAIVAERCRDPQVRVVVLRFGGDGLDVDPARVVGEAGPRDDPAHTALLLDAAVLAARDEGPWAGVHLMLVVDGLARARDVIDDLEHRLARAAPGVLLAVGGHRWADLRGGLRDIVGDRIELRLADVADSEHPRDRARLLMGAPPGRCLLADGRLAQIMRTSTPAASDEEDTRKLRPLPLLVPAPHGSRGIGVRIGDHREVLAPDGHLVVLGDRGSGRSTLLGRLLEQADRPVVLVDPLGRRPHPRAVTAADLPDRLAGFRRGLVLIDDADLIPAAHIAGLTDVLRERDVRVVLARPVTGAARAGYDPVMSALRDALASTLLLSGDPSEGPLAAGLRAAPGPPGRGVLVTPGEPPMPLQLYAPGDRVVVRLRGVA